MIDDKKDNNVRYDKWVITFVVAILGAVGGSGGGTYFYLNSRTPRDLEAIARPDPFTGAQAAEITTKIDGLSRSLIDLQRQVDNLPPRQLTERLYVLELEVRALRKEFDKHQD